MKNNWRSGLGKRIVDTIVNKASKAYKSGFRYAERIDDEGTYEFFKTLKDLRNKTNGQVYFEVPIKNPKKIKIKSIKQKAGGTVSYPEYIKVGNEFVKVKKPARKNPVSTYIKVFRHGHGDKKFSQKGYFTGTGWNTEMSTAKKYSAGEAKKLAMQLKIPDGWGVAIVSG